MKWRIAWALTMIVVACAVNSGDDTGKPAEPAKPQLTINHEIHAENGLECADCHDPEGKGEPAAPAAEFCFECHEDLENDTEKVKEYFAAAKSGDAYIWPGTSEREDDLIFSHASHMGSYETKCSDCHGETTAAAFVRAAPLVLKASCIDCHQQKGADAMQCAVCHTKTRKDQKPANHDAQFKNGAPVLAAGQRRVLARTRRRQLRALPLGPQRLQHLPHQHQAGQPPRSGLPARSRPGLHGHGAPALRGLQLLALPRGKQLRPLPPDHQAAQSHSFLATPLPRHHRQHRPPDLHGLPQAAGLHPLPSERQTDQPSRHIRAGHVLALRVVPRTASRERLLHLPQEHTRPLVRDAAPAGSASRGSNRLQDLPQRPASFRRRPQLPEVPPMNRTTSFFILLSLVLGASCNNDSRLEIPTVPESAIPSQSGDYAGSDTCRTCHNSIYETWANSRHTSKVRDASLDVLVNDFNVSGSSDFEKGGAGITFNPATSVPPNQTAMTDFTPAAGVDYPMLGYNGTDILIRIGPNTYVVTYVLGGTGKWKQRYMVTIDNQEYISPVQWNEITRQYVWYHPEHWYTINGNTLTGYIYGIGETPITEGKVRNGWQRRCIACHVTGVRDLTKNADGEYGASIADMEGSAEGPYFLEKPISCEACHGPSARHVDLGGGIGTTVNPNTMAADRGDEICGACHNRGTSANSEGFGYPWKEGTLIDGQYLPGDILDDVYTHVARDGSKFWGDGARSAKSHHQQWIEHRDTPHGKAGVTCWKCHDPHGSQVDGDLKMPVKELCLSCHDGQGDIDATNLSLHTRHKDAENQNCNYCHFVQTAKSAIAGDVSSHTYRLIYPSETDGTPGLPNSCGECHADRTVDQLTGMHTSRFPDVRPVAFGSTSAISGGTIFRLDGGQSFDPLGGPISFNWSIASAPPGFSPDQLIAPTAQTARFVPANPGKYTFRLVVTNLNGVRSAPYEVSVDAAESVVQVPVDLRQANYMGSSTCKICHEGNHSTWQVTRHPLKTRRPNEGPGVVFVDTDDNGTSDWFDGDFNVADDPLENNTAWDD
ncbi:MAG: ammonia-forming cytochrome c nitrite reductase subunit c552, partial [Planctomycetota bacterium]